MIFLLLANLYLVDQPNLAVPKHGIYGFQLRIGPAGEVITNAHLGLFNRLCLGLSWGASNMLGAGDPRFYRQPGIQARFMIIDQSVYMPTMLIGFDNQGFEGYSTEERRYTIRSKGVYYQLGKAFNYTGLSITPSLGMNYCLERDAGFDLFCGFLFQFGSSVQFIVEYSPNFNDTDDLNKGFMNIGLNYIFFEDVFFQFAVRDLLENIEGQQFNRMIKFGFQQAF